MGCMPYLDLHVHIRGTLRPKLARTLATRNGYSGFGDFLDKSDAYRWTDFHSFLNCYDAVTPVIQTAADLEAVAADYLIRTRSEGCLYVEFMLSPPDLARTGVPFSDQIKALESARETGRRIGIESRLIVTAVRHLGPVAAVEAARLAASQAGSLVVGFGLTGNELAFDVSEFAEAFRIAGDAGLKRTAHAGEHLAADTIIRTIDVLGLDRVGHGVRAVEDGDVLSHLAAQGIPLEVCLSSNLALKLYPDLACHPIGALMNAGCAVALGTDDPGFFGDGIALEYDLARQRIGEAGAAEIARTSVRAAFCDEQTRAALSLLIEAPSDPEGLAESWVHAGRATLR